MRWNRLFAVVPVLLVLNCVAQTSSDTADNSSTITNPGYTIAVAPPQGPIKLGSPIIVTITVTNTSGRDLYWKSDMGKNAPYKDFHYLLTGDGHEVETTFLHRKITGQNRPGDPNEAESGSSIVIAHPPGKMFVVPIDLTKLYEITKPGTYTLEVSRTEDDNKTRVRSNSLILDITQ